MERETPAFLWRGGAYKVTTSLSSKPSLLIAPQIKQRAQRELTMMKSMLLLAAVAASVSAAPAIVWKSGSSSSSTGPSHFSNAIDARSLLTSVVGNEGERNNDSSSTSSSLAAVIFLIGRSADGSEGFDSLASSGKIPGVQGRYLKADEVHHHVRGVESARTMASDARDAIGGGAGVRVAQVSMAEFQRKLNSIAAVVARGEDETMKVSKAEQRRRLAISEADVLIVTVGVNEDPTNIDAAIISAIDSSVVRNVVLSSIRSTAEVKHARKLAVGEKFAKKARSANNHSSNNRRRLQDEDAAEDSDSSSSTQGIYYVNMTPNIFAGLLFFFMFAFTAHLGLSCLNMIEIQDTFVTKYPHIGREV